MTYAQIIVPSPMSPTAEEGMCLQYVRQAYGLPARYGSATEAWENSASQHRDRDYPEGVWFPVWWALDKNVNGHVALVAPDGRVYSTSNLDPNPLKIHPNVADVEAYYARYGMTLTYRGWTEDVAGYPVITGSGINVEGSITTPQEDDMSLTDAQAKQLEYIASALFKVHIFAGSSQEEKDARTLFHKEALGQGVPWYGYDGKQPPEGQRRTTSPDIDLGFADTRAEKLLQRIGTLEELIKQLATKQGVVIDYALIAKAVNDDAANRMKAL